MVRPFGRRIHLQCMLLDRLEIRGFKSFGDKVVFHFDKGITGVVGPNGSGKSNVVDAIRWVLGEQSTRALRSDKMDNVIFNGTKNRKPLQMAEVSVTFKNTRNLLPTEYTEVTVTRRYYRSGEGEYLLNGVTCRLKDIHNLFLDTGISSDSYAIIELKMVDEILNDHQNSRRTLFEEAAGISKFKQRKKEALKKLEETDTDLARVEDLLFEIVRNLKSLEKQAKQAEKYLQVRQEYRQLSIELAKKTVSQYIDTLKSIEAQAQAELDQKTLFTAQISEQEALTEQAKTDLLGHEKLLASRQKTLNDHVHKIRQYESEHKIKNERTRFLNDKAANLLRQIEEDQKSNERALFSIESLEREQEGLEKQFRETSFLVDRHRQEYEEQKERAQVLKNQVQALAEQIRQKQGNVYQLKKNLEINQMQLSTLKQELERESSQEQEQTVGMAEFERKIAALEDELEDARRAQQVLEARQEEAIGQVQEAEQALQGLRAEQARSARTLDARQNEYALTKSLVDNLEGFPEAIRFVKKNTPWGANTPILSDIIACDEKYRVAIENFLEPFLNYFIVRDEETALQAIRLLGDAAKGKAHFFLIDRFDKYQPTPTRQYENAVPAIQLVEYDPQYRRIVEWLFENVYLATGDKLPKDPEATFILQSGKVVRRRYSASGGSVGLFEGKTIGRAKNLEKLSLDIRELQERVKNIERLIREKEQDIQHWKGQMVRDDLSALSQRNNLLAQELVAVRTRREQFEELLRSRADRREAISERLFQISEAIHEASPRLEQEEKALRHTEEEWRDLQEQLEEQNEALSLKSAAFNQQNLLFHQQQNRLDSLGKEIDYKRTSYERSKARIDNNRSDLQATEDEILRLQTHTGEGESALIALYEEKQSIEAGVQEAEKTYYDIRTQIAGYEKQISQLRQRREHADSVLAQLQTKANEARLQVIAVRDRLSVEFGVDLDAEMQQNPELHPLAAEVLRQEVQDIRTRLDRMGPINHTAIEAYQEIKERHDFIAAQRDDLLRAKTSLADTITEIEQVAKANFMTAFHTIRENFIQVFRTLFTQEDSCDLTLAEPEQPLESKIEIIARPKGKRPLTINQLSGGEKTLTATALLFAIYLLKPAPFCIFDEVDAPLDDANIDKFNQIIKKFSDNSQFIIVTHNKRTMASTDVIYGVTMIEQGVSTVVPVDLREGK